MSSTDRQNRLLVAEDWKRIYQSYRNADFRSYDFDNLRRTMINYLRKNYPEDFNDYTESSEYLALIDIIAFLGQNLSFRVDLNARENFLELAEKRESVLRFARLLSYNPKRNIASRGFLKLISVSTTESVYDSNNLNLQDQNISWNDTTNPNWYEQFIKILNSSFPVNSVFGKPIKKSTINGIPTEKYRFNVPNNNLLAVYPFARNVDGRSINFEVVPTDIGTDIIEQAPYPGQAFTMIYKEDGQGPGSSNSGFFSLFKQGNLNDATFNIGAPNTNQIVSIDSTNINNDDVWLYSLTADNTIDNLWTKVDSIEGNNVIYNSLSKDIRNIYSVFTRIEDKVSLIFSDGVFGNLPLGNFQVYYRTSINDYLTVSPRDLTGVSVSIDYVSRIGKIETITLTYDLQYTVDNSSPTESSLSIKQRAPSTYYTQNRLITAEDYQLGPLNISQEIIKVKSVNRISSGISRYFDLTDATGKYSKTNLFGNDGILYYETYNEKTVFSFQTETDIEGIIANIIEPKLSSTNLQNFYINNYPKKLVTDLNISWIKTSDDTNICTGFLSNDFDITQIVGSYTSSILKFIVPGSLLKFVAPTGYHFSKNGDLVTGEANYLGATTYKWAKVTSVYLKGDTLQDNGSGPIVLNDFIPNDAILEQILPTISRSISDDVKNQMIDQIFSYKTFGLRYDVDLREWKLIINTNLNQTNDFSLGKTGDITNQRLDSSWILKFTNNTEQYTIEQRGSRYIFESEQEIRFYFDSSDKVYNTLTGKIIKDKISILSNNNQLNSLQNFTKDFDWQITEEYRDPEGYISSNKIQVTFFDSDDDGVIDNPDIFNEYVPNDQQSYIFQKKYITANSVEEFNYIDVESLQIVIKQNKQAIGPTSSYDDGQLFYFIDEDIFQSFNKTTNTFSLITDYRAFKGRDKIKFHYVHAADDSSRIDPSASNIIDTYILTRYYDQEFRKYLNGTYTSKPLPMSSNEIYNTYGYQLNNIKSMTDEIIYHPVKYRILFGNKADISLQATFKIVKNTDIVINDNDVKTDVISAINQYFSLENWDFGDTFYFSELSAYVFQRLSPSIVTLVLVPVQTSQTYGSLQEIKSESDEIFISGATVDDIEIIDAVTATKLNTTGSVVTNTYYTNTGIQSSAI